MAQIVYENVSVSFPVFNRSLTSSLLGSAMGGKISAAPKGTINIMALRDINFRLNAGDKVAIIGHNGAGKSTLLRTLCGAYKPTAGEINKSGRVTSLIEINLGINLEATGKENAYLRGRVLGLSKRDVEQKYSQIVEFSGLGKFMDLPVRTYSTGMYLRLAFSVATVLDPEILVMDEWLAVGDEDFFRKAELKLIEMIANAQILVIASHSQELIRTICNRVIWLENGEIKMDGTVDEVLPAYFG
jgi:lipopolysaccharide transport system ATP-binding protein